MSTYIVAIEETISQEFLIEAENTEQAAKIAEEKYKNGEFVLESGEVSFKQMAVSKPGDEGRNWIEF